MKKNPKVLVCPSSYKGSLSSKEVAQAIVDGLHKINPGIEIKFLPLADGGDGTIDSVYHCLGGTLKYTIVIDALNRPIKAYWLMINDWALIELANCCGMATVRDLPLQPLLTSTYGLGQLICDCLNNTCKKIVIALGGSASTDGGTGALTALGVKFLDDANNSLPLGGKYLSILASMDLSQLDERLRKTRIEILTDVRSPLLGKNGTAAVFAPQKGANKNEINILENGLTKFSQVVNNIRRSDFRNVPGSGAAGGTAFGLASILDAQILPGFSTIAELIHLEQEIKNSDLIITAEGKLDFQSFRGKATGELAYLCKNIDKPLIVFPALVEGKMQWHKQGITSVYPTAKMDKYAKYEDIVEVVQNTLLIAKIFNSEK